MFLKCTWFTKPSTNLTPEGGVRRVLFTALKGLFLPVHQGRKYGENHSGQACAS